MTGGRLLVAMTPIPPGGAALEVAG